MASTSTTWAMACCLWQSSRCATPTTLCLAGIGKFPCPGKLYGADSPESIFGTAVNQSACCAQDTVIAVSRGGNRLRLNNMGSTHPEHDFGLDPSQVQPSLEPSAKSRVQHAGCVAKRSIPERAPATEARPGAYIISRNLVKQGISGTADRAPHHCSRQL